MCVLPAMTVSGCFGGEISLSLSFLLSRFILFSLNSCKDSGEQGDNMYVLEESRNKNLARRSSDEVEDPKETSPLTTQEDSPLESNANNV